MMRTWLLLLQYHVGSAYNFRVSKSLDCSDGMVDLFIPFGAEMSKLSSDCQSITPNLANLPFYTYSTAEYIFIIQRHNGVLQEKLIPQEEGKIKILILEKSEDYKTGSFDAVIACLDDCTYTIHGREIVSDKLSSPVLITRKVPVSMLDFSVPNFAPTIALKNLVGIRFCVVKVDSRIANYDYQIEWIQASFHEEPCKTIDLRGEFGLDLRISYWHPSPLSISFPGRVDKKATPKKHLKSASLLKKQ